MLALFCVFGIMIGIGKWIQSPQSPDAKEKVMNNYKLTFTVTIKGQDDPGARQQAKNIAEAFAMIVSAADAKLQQVYWDKPPRGVQIT